MGRPELLPVAALWLQGMGVDVGRLMADAQTLGFDLALVRVCLGIGTRMASMVHRANG